MVVPSGSRYKASTKSKITGKYSRVKAWNQGYKGDNKPGALKKDERSGRLVSKSASRAAKQNPFFTALKNARERQVTVFDYPKKVYTNVNGNKVQTGTKMQRYVQVDPRDIREKFEGTNMANPVAVYKLAGSPASSKRKSSPRRGI
tara:strand:+ start:5153 stop:5590 length:438 start_codon:yes stop_codon:yes gene_type:complete